MANDITLHLNNTEPVDDLLPDTFYATLADESATLSAGAQFAKYVTAKQMVLADQTTTGVVIYLHGDLGAGKTTFTRGFLQGLGFSGKVKSPTYTLVEPYVFSRYNIYHFDLYRFMGAEEWEESGFREYFNPQSICLIEWPEKAMDLLPAANVHVHLTHDNLQRKIQISVNAQAANTGQDKRFNLTNFKLE